MSLGNWVDGCLESLQLTLPRVLTFSPSYAIKGEDFDDQHYQTFIEEAEIFIIILDQSFTSDIHYREELKLISNHLKLSSEFLASRESVLFKIARTDIERSFLPENMRDLSSYEFYELHESLRKEKIFDFSDDNSTESWAKMLDLAYDIRTTFKRLPDPVNDNTVFLGFTNDDDNLVRDEVRREIQQLGYKIEPTVNLPKEPDELESMIHYYLRKSKYIVQLVGTKYGQLVPGLKISYLEYQHQIVSNYLKQHEENSPYRYIWIPVDHSRRDHKLNLYIQRLKRDYAANNSEIVEAPLEAFKSELRSKLSTRSKRKQFKNHKSVYMIYQDEYNDEILPFKLVLEKLEMNCLELDSTSGKSYFQQHLDHIKTANMVAIYVGDKNNMWFRSKIRDLLKAPGVGRSRPFEDICVISHRRLELKDLELFSSEVHFIDPDLEAFENHINKLAVKVNG